jgi:hypothetical protein
MLYWVGLRAGLEDLEKWIFLTLPGLELRSLGDKPLATRYTYYVTAAPIKSIIPVYCITGLYKEVYLFATIFESQFMN